jgi:hypothetical protein
MQSASRQFISLLAVHQKNETVQRDYYTNINHKPVEWILFLDSSKWSLKAVLLHNGNMLPSIPVGHAVNMKESYDNM